jgi:hypothetical protein
MPTLTPTVTLAVTRWGDFGDRLQITAMVDGIAPSHDRVGEIMSVSYRGRSVAWIEFPIGADRQAVAEAMLARADWFLGSRCPEMETYPLTFD